MGFEDRFERPTRVRFEDPALRGEGKRVRDFERHAHHLVEGHLGRERDAALRAEFCPAMRRTTVRGVEDPCVRLERTGHEAREPYATSIPWLEERHEPIADRWVPNDFDVDREPLEHQSLPRGSPSPARANASACVRTVSAASDGE